MFLDHTQRRSTVGRTPRPEESYRLCCVVVCDLETSRMGAPYIYDISRLRVKLKAETRSTFCVLKLLSKAVVVVTVLRYLFNVTVSKLMV